MLSSITPPFQRKGAYRTSYKDKLNIYLKKSKQEFAILQGVVPSGAAPLLSPCERPLVQAFWYN